ncbi:MAG: nucleotidyl transferase AbiEii/AbiGii toxin family protein [Methanosarcinales archaeon]|nr:nucleotidyl transferase AbiEii/AbiGii toxin family protein [Methanosarcinales archaeon]
MNMALKGGTGIRKVYIENYRFSNDLDFTLLEKMDSVALNDLLGSAVLGARDGREIYADNHIILARPENVAICELDLQDAISIQKGEKQTP